MIVPSFPAGLLGKLFVPTVINARATDGGLDSVITDLPTSWAGRALHRADGVHAAGPAGRGDGPVHAQPDVVRAGDDDRRRDALGEPAAPVTRTSSFTPTACGALPFEPHIEGVGRRERQDRPAGQAAVQTVITQGAEQAGQSSVTVGLPPIVGPDLAQLARACPAEQALARACPDSARVGTVTATTPLLAQPLTGSVYLASRGVGAIPGLTIQLADPIPLRLEGAVELTANGIRTTFTGLPDVPLSRFQLDLVGGPRARSSSPPTSAPRAPPVVTAAFVAQSGKQAAETKPRPSPAARRRRRRGAHHAAALRPPQGPRRRRRGRRARPTCAQVRVLLPSALEAKPKRKRRGARARTGSGRLARSAIELTRTASCA